MPYGLHCPTRRSRSVPSTTAYTVWSSPLRNPAAFPDHVASPTSESAFSVGSAFPPVPSVRESIRDRPASVGRESKPVATDFPPARGLVASRPDLLRLDRHFYAFAAP